MNKNFEPFLKDMEVRNYSPESIRKYSHCVKLFLGWIEGKGFSDFRKVGKPELRAYQVVLSHNPRFSVHHVAANVRAVKCFFRFLRKTGVVLYDFSAALREPKAPKYLPKEPLTTKEINLMLEAPDLRNEIGIRDRAILETFYSTGIRVSEMANLTLLDVHLEEGLLFVNQGKGRKDRVVPLGKHACSFIETYLGAARAALTVKNKDSQAVKTNRLWISKRGKPLGALDINFMVRHYRKKAGIKKAVTPHSFRRTLAVELIRNECDFLAVKEILGHSRSETTLRYCALSGVELKEAHKKSHPRYEVEELDDAKLNIKSFGR